MKKTAIIGATTNPGRYAYMAAQLLTEYGHEIVPIGIKKGEVFDKQILDIREKPQVEGIDTITMYLGPQNQPEWYAYILSLRPKRIIFNPGTENHELERLAHKQGIETEEACTLVMLRVGNY
ncbi:CoA-binding protein [Fulvivirga sp. 29W222]|uniref:CoA-binding protein n=1 Tax=Fulvivirga marina TaxID=2494733 RepID=A0A937FTU9_9BACT|nr:CoA-binding protein [Fulvivirga marina]MBL6444808.1 CoA-binding protein [Fulvivirga marina]